MSVVGKNFITLSVVGENFPSLSVVGKCRLMINKTI